MDVLEIRYETGHMTINVPVYFPCLQKHARKLFPLIKRYTAPERTGRRSVVTCIFSGLFCRRRWKTETAFPAYHLIGSMAADSSHTAWRKDRRFINGWTATTGFIANWM